MMNNQSLSKYFLISFYSFWINLIIFLLFVIINTLFITRISTGVSMLLQNIFPMLVIIFVILFLITLTLCISAGIVLGQRVKKIIGKGSLFRIWTEKYGKNVILWKFLSPLLIIALQALIYSTHPIIRNLFWAKIFISFLLSIFLICAIINLIKFIMRDFLLILER